MATAGKDATQDFEEIGHSNSAKKLLEKYLIGKYEVGCCTSRVNWLANAHTILTVSLTFRAVHALQGGDSAPEKPAKAAATATASSSSPSSSTRMFHVLLPVVLLAMAIGLNYYASSKKANTA